MSEVANSHAYSKLEHCETKYGTKFYPWEKGDGVDWEGEEWQNPDAFRFSNKKKMWEFWEEMHRGIRNGKHTNKPYFTHVDNLHLIETVSSVMELPEPTRRKAKAAYFSVHNKKIRGQRKDLTAVAVCAFVGETEGMDYHPQKLDDEGIPLADKYAAQFICRPDDIVKRYGKVQHHLRNGIPQLPGHRLHRMEPSRISDGEPNLDAAESEGGGYLNV